MLKPKDFLSDRNSVQILEVKSFIDHAIALGRITNHWALKKRVTKFLSQRISEVEEKLTIDGGLNTADGFLVKELIQLLQKELLLQSQKLHKASADAKWRPNFVA